MIQATNFVTAAQELLFVVKKMLQEKKQERKQAVSPSKSSMSLEAESKFYSKLCHMVKLMVYFCRGCTIGSCY